METTGEEPSTVFSAHSKQCPTVGCPQKIATVWPTDSVNVSIWTNPNGYVEVEVFCTSTGTRKCVKLTYV